jgi:hypothetical protein
MKHLSTIKKGEKNWKLFALVVFCLTVLPAISFGQPAPPGPGGTGGNPDTPLGGVPFDNNMNLLFLLVGVVFAIVILKKSQNKRSTNSQRIIDHY